VDISILSNLHNVDKCLELWLETYLLILVFKMESVSLDVIQTPIVQTPYEQTPIVQTPHEQTPIVQTPHEQTPIVQTPHEQTPIIIIPGSITPVTPSLCKTVWYQVRNITVITCAAIAVIAILLLLQHK
jgi:hypothetical protein